MGLPTKEQLPIENLPEPAEEISGLSLEQTRPTALVHVLTPEFHGLNPEDFADIPDEVVARASAGELQSSLFWTYVRKGDRTEDEVSAFSYLTPDKGVISVALTPEEYDTASESVGKLAQRMFNRVLASRDKKLREQTGDENARARTEEDIRIARRGAVRAVIDKQASMQELLATEVLTKIELIEKFIEMTEGKNANMARGTKETVSRRFEELRTTVFDDMLDAVALQRGWSVDMTDRAKLVIQKRLYIGGTASGRVANFKEMLLLAKDYYGHKRALILTKNHEAAELIRANPEVVADIITVDEDRRLEKEARQLQFEDAD